MLFVRKMLSLKNMNSIFNFVKVRPLNKHNSRYTTLLHDKSAKSTNRSVPFTTLQWIISSHFFLNKNVIESCWEMKPTAFSRSNIHPCISLWKPPTLDYWRLNTLYVLIVLYILLIRQTIHTINDIVFLKRCQWIPRNLHIQIVWRKKHIVPVKWERNKWILFQTPNH